MKGTIYVNSFVIYFDYGFRMYKWFNGKNAIHRQDRHISMLSDEKLCA